MQFYASETCSGLDTRPRSEDRLLLDEAHHRTANEVTAAIAAVRLAKAAPSPHTRRQLLDGAIQRLEGFGRMHQLMGAPVPRTTDVAIAIQHVVSAIFTGRFVKQDSEVTLMLPSTRVDGETARTLVIVAHELILNGIKHAFGDRGGEMHVQLGRAGPAVVLTVRDFGPGISGARTGGSGLGGSLVHEMVTKRGGIVERTSGAAGTTVRVTLPVRSGRRPSPRGARS